MNLRIPLALVACALPARPQTVPVMGAIAGMVQDPAEIREKFHAYLNAVDAPGPCGSTPAGVRCR